MEKFLSISLELNFTPNSTLGCYGLSSIRLFLSTSVMNRIPKKEWIPTKFGRAISIDQLYNSVSQALTGLTKKITHFKEISWLRINCWLIFFGYKII